MTKIHCFAYVRDKNHEDCCILTEMVCESGECPFYKSRAQVNKEKQDTEERLMRIGFEFPKK